MKNIKKFNDFVLESNDNDVVSFLIEQMKKDKADYKGHIPTKFNKGSEWDDTSWLVDEIIQFLSNNHTSSYTLMNFGNKYDYDYLDSVLKDNFKTEYERALQKLSE
jgi:hypothetical protein